MSSQAWRHDFTAASIRRARPRLPVHHQRPHPNPNDNHQARLQELQRRLEDLPSILDSFSLTSLLQTCGELKALPEGKRVHGFIHNKGFQNVRVLCHGLISMYGKCGSVKNAQIVFDNIKYRNVVSWNAIIGTYIQNGHGKEGLRFFKCMKVEGIKPNRVTFMTVLNACDSPEALDEGKSIHACVSDSGLAEDVAVGSALVNMYSKCGDLELSRMVFDEMGNKDIVAWNGLITVYAQNGHSQNALQVYGRMLSEGMQANKVTFTVVLNACVSPDALVDGKILHASIIEAGFECDVTVGNALINSYGKCDSLVEAQKVFDRMPQRDVVSWNTFILVCAHNGYRGEALRLFQQMQLLGVKPSELSYVTILSACTDPAHLAEGKTIHESAINHRLASNVLVGNALLCMYSNCGSADDAQKMFENLQDRSMMSWNAIISACDRHGLGMEAREHFWHMLREGTMPNEFTFASVVSACANTVALEEGQLIHALASESSFESDDVVMSVLVNMYGRCGSVEDAQVMFKKMLKRTVITWTAMVASYAQQGNGQEAVHLFCQMHREGFEPNEISFVSILSACSHAGLVDEGCYYFSSMCQDHKIAPIAIHYCCLVDLFGRTGMLDVAECVIKEMPFQPDSVEWYTLLCACKSQGDVERGVWVAEQVLELHPQHSAAYVSLSNIYASAGMWELG